MSTIDGASLDRRSLLSRLAGLGVWIWVAGPWSSSMGCAEAEPACYDPELLSTAERAARRSRGYVDLSPDRGQKACGGCTFFEAGEPVGCGRCSILAGPVSVMGICEAWSAKAAG